MKYLMLLFTVILFTACEGGETSTHETYIDSLEAAGMTAEQIDSMVKMREEEEMGAHILEGVLMR